MVDKNEAPFGCYAVKSVNKRGCHNCDIDDICVNYWRKVGCTVVFRKDETNVYFKARWWFKPILFILKLGGRL
jgi:hypothetical protein